MREVTRLNRYLNYEQSRSGQDTVETQMGHWPSAYLLYFIPGERTLLSKMRDLLTRRVLLAQVWTKKLTSLMTALRKIEDQLCENLENMG